MPRAWQVGSQIQGRWEIYQVLSGGAGVVYVVYDHRLRAPFAAKTFLDEVYEQDPAIAERFAQEALAWTRLDLHPNVVQARMVEIIDGRPFVFLEYVSGGDLSHWIGTPRLTEDLRQVMRFSTQFCDGMIHASSRGIRVHRDVKPRNCMVTGDRTLKVTDFGLAKSAGANRMEEHLRQEYGFEPASITMSGVGTCTHMAPEQFHDAQSVDVRADVYSFGVMLYQMLTGKLPFQGETWEELEILHRERRPPRLDHPNQMLGELVATCLAKRPDERPADFEQVRERLGAIYRQEFGELAPSAIRGVQLSSWDWNNKGSSLDQLGLHQEALACFDQALVLNPASAEPWFNKGVALHALQKKQEALECYERALAVNPRSEQAWSNKGVVLKALGRTGQALDCYQRALELNPRYPEAWTNKGVALRAAGKNDEALGCYQRALQLNPSDAKVWVNQGNALYALGRMEQALSSYERATMLNAQLEHAWLQKGLALMALGRAEQAVQSFDRALQLAPKLEQAWYYKAAALVNAFGRYGDALPYFQQAQRLGFAQAAEGVALCRKMLQPA
jgi:tetratricopeptide (TPR) repeat protein